MTVNPRVNPKKLRPYDQPPKRRRTWIPDAPDSAAAGFFVAAALWLALAAGLGVLAIGLRIVPFEFEYPFGFFDLAFQLDARRVEYAFVNATVYGWLTNAGFAVIAFMTPRLIGTRLALEKLLMLGLVIWNMTLLGGLGLLYILDLGVHAPLTAFPWFVDGGLATGAFVVTAAFALTAARAILGAYVSVWFAGAALLSLLGLLSVNAGLGLLEFFIDVDELLVAMASAFVERAIVTMWLLGMAFAALHYVVPRAAAAPLASGGVAILTFLTWLLLAPASAIATLTDPSVPYLFTLAGSVATMLLLVPAGLAAGNVAATLSGRWSLALGTGPAAVALVSLAFLFGTALIEALGSLRGVDAHVSGTEWENGVFIWAAYGAFTLAAVAVAAHALPRIMKRAWGGGLLSSATLWLVFSGAALAGVALMGGGLAEGALIAQGTTPEDLDAQLVVYRAAALGAFGLVALGGLAMVIDLFLMYTSGEPIAYNTPGQPAAAGAGH